PAPEVPPRNLVKLSGNHPLTGITIANLSPAYAEELGLSPGLTGVIITEMPRRSPAVQIGLQPGDILLSIGQDKIKLTEDVVRLTRTARDVWEIRIRRGDQVLSVRVGT
ncbi:MAG: PDZ domain-containing protein, partial [Alphaproteobacteria bacterium]